MGDIGGALAGLLGALIALMVLVRFMRRSGARRPPGPREPVFDQGELYAMLNSGQITPAEFDRLRALVLARQPQPELPPFAGVPVAPRGPRGFEPLPLPTAPVPEPRDPHPGP